MTISVYHYIVSPPLGLSRGYLEDPVGMEFTIYRDLASIAFVRCTSPVPGTRFCAEGTGFSVIRAIDRCRSERIERLFQLTHPLRSQMVGIAAHPNAAASAENAGNEAIETLLLKQLGVTPVLYGVSFRFFGPRFFVGRVNDRFIGRVLFPHRGVTTATHAVCKNPLKAVLKAWTEVRNLHLYNPPVEDLPIYTKANRLLCEQQLSSISVRFSLRANIVETHALRRFQVRDQSHFVTYITQEAT